MKSFRPSPASRQAYIQRTMRAQRNDGMVFGVGQVVRDGGGVGADLFRHALTLIGVFGLVGIAAGALTGSSLYETVLNWISSFFVR
jgi:hypothetical protein